MKKLSVLLTMLVAQGAFAMDLPSEILSKVLMNSVWKSNRLSESEKDAKVLARKNRVLQAALEGQSVSDFTANAYDVSCDSAMGGRQHCLILIAKNGSNPNQPSGTTIAFDVFIQSGEVISADMKAVAGGGI